MSERDGIVRCFSLLLQAVLFYPKVYCLCRAVDDDHVLTVVQMFPSKCAEVVSILICINYVCVVGLTIVYVDSVVVQSASCDTLWL